jgi:hypothetical protein
MNASDAKPGPAGFVDVPTTAHTHAVCHECLGVPVNAFAIGRALATSR